MMDISTINNLRYVKIIFLSLMIGIIMNILYGCVFFLEKINKHKCINTENVKIVNTFLLKKQKTEYLYIKSVKIFDSIYNFNFYKLHLTLPYIWMQGDPPGKYSTKAYFGNFYIIFGETEDTNFSVRDSLLNLAYKRAIEKINQHDIGVVIIDTIKHEYYIYAQVQFLAKYELYEKIDLSKIEGCNNIRVILLWMNGKIYIICDNGGGIYFPKVKYDYKDSSSFILIDYSSIESINAFVKNYERYKKLYESGYFWENY